MMQIKDTEEMSKQLRKQRRHDFEAFKDMYKAHTSKNRKEAFDGACELFETAYSRPFFLTYRLFVARLNMQINGDIPKESKYKKGE